MNQTCGIDSTVEHPTCAAFYSLFFIVSCPANCLTLLVAWRLMMKGNSMAVYLISLSISDLLYTFSLPVWIELALQRNVSEGVCIAVNLIMYNSFYVGSGLLCCISVDRYLAVVYPLYFHQIRKLSVALTVSTAVWILEIFLHIILVYHMGALQASRLLCEQQTPMRQEDATVSLTRFSLGFLVPAFIMAFCFQQIMHSLKQSPSIQTEERRKVGRLLLFLFLTYLVSFVPYQTVMLLRAILEPGNCEWAKKLKDPYLGTVVLTTLNCTLDPIIYCLISDSARKELWEVAKRGTEVFTRGKGSEMSTGIQTVS